MAYSLQRYISPNSNSSFTRLLKERSQIERERAVRIAIENGDCLYENIIVEILSWLPVKYLLRYKAVCKSWYAIISSPDFISKHLKNYYQNNNDWRGCLLAQYSLDSSNLGSYGMLLDETPRILAHDILHDIPISGSSVRGPCDGLYYLYLCGYNSATRAIWNPAINELKVLPPLITKPDPPPNTTFSVGEDYGFGLDPITRDYKVVVMRTYRSATDYYSDDEYPMSIFVYSLRNDSWKYCGDIEPHRRFGMYDKTYNYVNGCYYWLEVSNMSDVILSFNLATDAFQLIHVPNHKHPASRCLAVYDDSLAFLSVHRNDEDIEVWTWDSGIWTKKFTTGPFPGIRNPVGHWKDNKLIFEYEGNKLVLLDPHTKDLKDLAYQSYTFWCVGIFVYMESLVSVKDDQNVTEAASNSESDLEFGISELFSCETSESDSDYGMKELFCVETDESDSEFGIGELFYDDEANESDSEFGIGELFYEDEANVSNSEFEVFSQTS